MTLFEGEQSDEGRDGIRDRHKHIHPVAAVHFLVHVGVLDPDAEACDPEDYPEHGGEKVAIDSVFEDFPWFRRDVGQGSPTDYFIAP